MEYAAIIILAIMTYVLATCGENFSVDNKVCNKNGWVSSAIYPTLTDAENVCNEMNKFLFEYPDCKEQLRPELICQGEVLNCNIPLQHMKMLSYYDNGFPCSVE